MSRHLPEWRNGRRDGLKIRYPQGCVGSSPSSGIHRINKLGDSLCGCPFLLVWRSLIWPGKTWL
jgi:hypothetical protein